MTPTRVFVVAPTPTMSGGAALDARRRQARTNLLVVKARPVLSAGPVPPLAEADVVLVADEELLEETALSVSEDGTQSLLLLSEDEGTASRLRTLASGDGASCRRCPVRGARCRRRRGGPGPDCAPEEPGQRMLDEPAAAVEELSEPMTERESEVLDLLGHGLSNKMIARELHISEHTVKFHISSLYSKLG